MPCSHTTCPTLRKTDGPPVCAQKSVKLKCLTDRETRRTPDSVYMLYRLFEQHFSRQCLQCLMVKAYCPSDVFQNALRTCVFHFNNYKVPTAFLLVFKTMQRDSSRRGQQKTVSRLRRHVPTFTLMWTVHEMPPVSVIYIEGCACGMGNFARQ